MFHKRCQIEVPKYVLSRSLDDLCDLASLIHIFRDLLDLSNEELVISRVAYRPIQPGEDCRGIANHKPAEEFLIHFHTVDIKELGLVAG